MKYLWGLASVMLVSLPKIVSAQQIVPCGDEGEPACQTCHLYQLVENAFGWMFGILLTVAAIVIVLGGFRLVTSGGNMQAKQDARKIIGTSLLSVILVGTSWTLVDITIATLYGQADAGSIWTSLVCVEQPVPTAAPTSTLATGCSDCVDVPPGLSLRAGGGVCNTSLSPTGNCQLSASVIPQMVAMHAEVSAMGIGARVTEAWPPTVTHANPCHQAGTCIDYNLPGLDAGEISAIIIAAQRQGLRPVYEVRTEPERQALIDAGVPASNIQAVRWITAPHFSIYGP